MRRSFIVIICLSFLIACNTGDKKDPAVAKDEYEKTKENLREKEKINPVLFLSVSGKDRKNLIGQLVVKGKITNKAVVTSYKDVEVKMVYYSKTGALLENDKEVVFETIKPGRSIDFKTKYFAPKGSDSVALSIISAKVAE